MTARAQAGPTGRLALLLAEIRREEGEWTTVRVMRLYQQADLATARIAHMRSIARGDLRELRRRGCLKQHDPSRRRFFTLNARKDSE